MPLTWDITACKADVDLNSEAEWPCTYVIIMATMHTGIGHLTEANAAEFYARIHFLELIDGNLLIARDSDGKEVDRKITPLDVRRRIGLRTNVFPLETQLSFIKRHTKWLMRDFAKAYLKTEPGVPIAEPV